MCLDDDDGGGVVCVHTAIGVSPTLVRFSPLLPLEKSQQYLFMPIVPM